ncbi:MAG: PLP-dependent aminotransferase family protein [Thermomicrobiales bacterium]|nr:PLP-dependent aminotransferase family protein [Thermomicrobiales bacterium]
MSQVVSRTLSDRFADRTNVFGSSIWTDILTHKEKHTDPVYFGDGAPAPEMLPIRRLAQSNAHVWEDATGALAYGDQQGWLPLREWIATNLQNRSIDATAANIMTTAGSTQALDFAARVFLQPGDAVIAENPTFLGAIDIFHTYEAEVIGVECDADGMLMDKLEETILNTPNAKVIYTIPTFQNPAGTNMPLERRQRLVELAREHNLAIFEDDPYGDLQYSGEVIPPLRALDDQVIYFGTFSKVIAPGLRVGYVVAPTEVAVKLLATREVADVNNDRITMRTVYHTIQDDFLTGHIEECRDFYRSRRDAMLAALEREMPEGVSWSRPDGGFFVWITLPDHITSEQIFDVAAEYGVVAFPGKWFDPQKQHAHSIRLSFSTVPEDRIALGIERLGAAIRSVM